MQLRLVDFAGEWRLARRIRDRLTGQQGRFDGTADLVPAEEGGWVWTETGTLRMGDAPALEGTRRYLWSESDGRIAVRFADGRAFHSFSPGVPEAAHWCDPDDYRVRYDFSAWPVWCAEWRVHGPRKDYTMRTEYRRAAA